MRGAKRKTEQVARSKDMVGEAGCVSVMLLNFQIGLVIEKSVQNMGCIPDRRVDDLGSRCRSSRAEKARKISHAMAPKKQLVARISVEKPS